MRIWYRFLVVDFWVDNANRVSNLVCITITYFLPKFSKTLLILICTYIGIYAQEQKDFSQLKLQAINTYKKAFKNHQLLQQGKEYGYFYSNVKGNYVLGDSVGSLKYDGIFYPEVDLHYDTYNDLVLVRNNQAGGRRYLIIKQAKVEAFTINGIMFIHLQEPIDSLIETGIYQLAFDQNGMRLLVKKRKTLDKNTSRLPTEIKVAQFVSSDIHYLNTPTKTFQIKNKRDLFDAFQHQERIKAYIKSEKIRFTPQKEEFTNQIIKILIFNHKQYH